MYVNDAGAEVNVTEYFYLKSRSMRFTTRPYRNVVRVINKSQIGKVDSDGETLLEKDVIVPANKYSVSYLGNEGNVFESCVITFSSNPENRSTVQPNGDYFPNYSLGVYSSFVKTVPGVTGVAEVFDLEITNGASYDGNITLTINGTEHSVGVTGGDVTGLIATKVRTYIDDLSDYNAAVNGSKVTVTAVNLRSEQDATFSGGATGVLGTITVTTQGVTGSVEVDTVTVHNTASNPGTVQAHLTDGVIDETFNIQLSANDYPDSIANKIKLAALNNTNIANYYMVENTVGTPNIVLTRKVTGLTPFNFTLNDTATGDQLGVIYTCNNLIVDIQNIFSEEAKRSVTADVLVKQANIAYVYVGLNVHAKLGYSIGTVEKAYISSVVASYINTTNFVTSLSADGIISMIREDTKISSFLDYIELPIVFYSLNTIEGSLRPNTAEFNVYNSAVTFPSTFYPMLQLCEVTVV